MKKIFSLIIFCMCVLLAQVSFAHDINFSYRAHVQDRGWMPAVMDGDIAGTIGENRRLEAIWINMRDGGRNMIKYCAHVENYGWLGWQSSGDVAGTVGQGLRMEAIRIKLESSYARKFDIYYRAHVQNAGWLGWAKNGEPAGTAGAGLRMEAFQIRLMPKDMSFDRGGQAFYEKKNHYRFD